MRMVKNELAMARINRCMRLTKCTTAASTWMGA